MARTSRSAHISTDHDHIRQWAESHGGWPAAVKTGKRGDAGILRIDFPGFTGKNLTKISWDEWFATFDKSHLALLHRDADRFNKLIRIEDVEPEATRGNGRRTRSARSTRSTTRAASRSTARSSARSPRGNGEAKGAQPKRPSTRSTTKRAAARTQTGRATVASTRRTKGTTARRRAHKR